MVTIEELKLKINKNSRLIGLDLGSKRIGIAICDEYQSIATPFKTIQKDNFNKFLDEVEVSINGNVFFFSSTEAFVTFNISFK